MKESLIQEEKKVTKKTEKYSVNLLIIETRYDPINNDDSFDLEDKKVREEFEKIFSFEKELKLMLD